MNRTATHILALAVTALNGCAEIPSADIEAAHAAVAAARQAGADEYFPTEFKLLEIDLRRMDLEMATQQDEFILFRDYDLVKQIAVAAQKRSKRMEAMAQHNTTTRLQESVRKMLGEDGIAALRRALARTDQETTLSTKWHNRQQELETTLQDLEDQHRRGVFLSTILIWSGVFVLSFYLLYQWRHDLIRRRRKIRMENKPSSPAVQRVQQRTSATSVDLGFNGAMEAAKSRSISRQDRKEQDRLRKLLKQRTKTGYALKEAVVQEAEIQTTINQVHEARGEYDQLPAKERAQIEREIAEHEAGFFGEKVKTAEAQKKIAELKGETREDEALKQAIIWQERIRQEENFLDPQYREEFARTNSAQILNEWRKEWEMEHKQIMQDRTVVGWCYHAFPEVLKWVDARREVVRLAERFAMKAQHKGG